MITMLIKAFFDNLSSLTVIFFFLGIALSYLPKFQPTRKTHQLESKVMKGLSASTIPSAIALVICSLYPQILTNLDPIRLGLAVAGIVLFAIAISSFKSK